MIEKLFELLAPDECIVCGVEGKCLCEECEPRTLVAKKQCCVFCNKLSESGRTCSNCIRKFKLSGARILCRYDATTKELIGEMKYKNKRSIARYFGNLLPLDLPLKDPLICYVPSDGPTRRSRGYDHAQIIAKTYAKKLQLKPSELLIRIKHSPQVGKGRIGRLKNVEGNFVTKKQVANRNIILVDDVVTTGATISECAKVLKKSGAKSVWAVAIAKK